MSIHVASPLPGTSPGASLPWLHKVAASPALLHVGYVTISTIQVIIIIMFYVFHVCDCCFLSILRVRKRLRAHSFLNEVQASCTVGDQAKFSVGL